MKHDKYANKCSEQHSWNCIRIQFPKEEGNNDESKCIRKPKWEFKQETTNGDRKWDIGILYIIYILNVVHCWATHPLGSTIPIPNPHWNLHYQLPKYYIIY